MSSYYNNNNYYGYDSSYAYPQQQQQQYSYPGAYYTGAGYSGKTETAGRESRTTAFARSLKTKYVPMLISLGIVGALVYVVLDSIKLRDKALEKARQMELAAKKPVTSENTRKFDHPFPDVQVMPYDGTVRDDVDRGQVWKSSNGHRCGGDFYSDHLFRELSFIEYEDECYTTPIYRRGVTQGTACSVVRPPVDVDPVPHCRNACHRNYACSGFVIDPLQDGDTTYTCRFFGGIPQDEGEDPTAPECYYKTKVFPAWGVHQD